MTRNNSGLIVNGGNVVAGALAVNGDATNYGDVHASIGAAVDALHRAVESTSASPETKAKVANELQELKKEAEVDKPAAASRLTKIVEMLKAGGATIRELLAISTPLGALAQLVGSSLAMLGF
ncbi:MAG TPA: hypothetical protein VFN10_23850 [Thermoanaerobaculia bacterium]|nr:hypothetical protein [Thermoanaerobaculia bacterium]